MGAYWARFNCQLFSTHYCAHSLPHSTPASERGDTKLGDTAIGFPKRQSSLEQPTIFATIVCPTAASLGVKFWSRVAQGAELNTTWGQVGTTKACCEETVYWCEVIRKDAWPDRREG